jgi:glutamine synthetase
MGGTLPLLLLVLLVLLLLPSLYVMVSGRGADVLPCIMHVYVHTQPIFQSWGGNNRSNTLRCNPGRVELRAADSACNPYLAFALCVAAGLEGIEQNLQPPAPNEGNLFERMDGLTPAQCEAAGVGRLPTTLSEAVDVFEADPLSKEVFGDLMFDEWRRFKREEWAEYHDYVSQWEMDRYLKMY